MDEEYRMEVPSRSSRFIYWTNRINRTNITQISSGCVTSKTYYDVLWIRLFHIESFDEID